MNPREVSAAWFQRIWNEGDESAIEQLAAQSAKFHGLPSGEGRSFAGPEAFRTYVRFFRQAIPDIRVQVVRSVCEGDLVAVHCVVTGTNTGPGFGGTPTGKSIAFEGMAIARIEDGKLQEGWNCFDGKSLYQQLGLLPPDPVQDIGLGAA